MNAPEQRQKTLPITDQIRLLFRCPFVEALHRGHNFEAAALTVIGASRSFRERSFI